MNKEIITPEQMEADSKRIQERLDAHTNRFANLDKFLAEADIAVQYYFAKQTEFPDVESFKLHLKILLQKYVAYFELKDYKSMREQGSEIDMISETYDEIVYFGEYNPVKSRRERLETGMTIEEQRAKPKGLVFKFQDAVRKIF